MSASTYINLRQMWAEMPPDNKTDYKNYNNFVKYYYELFNSSLSMSKLYGAQFKVIYLII